MQCREREFFLNPYDSSTMLQHVTTRFYACINKSWNISCVTFLWDLIIQKQNFDALGTSQYTGINLTISVFESRNSQCCWCNLNYYPFQTIRNRKWEVRVKKFSFKKWKFFFRPWSWKDRRRKTYWELE